MSEPYWVPLGGSPGPTGPPGGAGAIAIGTALPVSPVDGQEFILVDSLTVPTYSWRFRYMSAKATNKWLFVGGSLLYAEILNADTTTLNPYVVLATPGPSIAIPVAGDYTVDLGYQQTTSTKPGYMSYDIGATPATAADGVMVAIPGVLDAQGTPMRRRRKSLPAVTLTAKYGAYASQNVGFSNRWISALPIAVGG
jgi:hypothetical protein